MLRFAQQFLWTIQESQSAIQTTYVHTSFHFSRIPARDRRSWRCMYPHLTVGHYIWLTAEVRANIRPSSRL